MVWPYITLLFLQNLIMEHEESFICNCEQWPQSCSPAAYKIVLSRVRDFLGQELVSLCALCKGDRRIKSTLKQVEGSIFLYIKTTFEVTGNLLDIYLDCNPNRHTFCIIKNKK